MININKKQAKIIFNALYEAIESRDSLIDAYRTDWDKRRTASMPEKCIPKEYRADVNKWKKMIKQYKEIQEYIKNEMRTM